MTEAQLKSIAQGSLVVEEGATLTMTGKETGANSTSSAMDNVSGAGDVVLHLAKDNGVGFNLNGIEGDIIVAEGRLQVNSSTFNDESTIRLAKTSDSANTNGELVFNGTGTVLKNNVELETSTTMHVNNGKNGTISGVISGEGGLTKACAGALTLTSQNTYTGVTNIRDGKIILSTGGDYKLYNTITDGSLEVASGTTLVNNEQTITSSLTLANGSAAEMNGSRKLQSDITVNKDATLAFTGNGSDTMDYGVSKNLTVDGGTVDFGATRQTISGWTLTLKNGALLTGDGAGYYKEDHVNYTDYTAAMDFNKDATVNVTSGPNTIAANMRLRSGDARSLTFNVSAGASLDISGRMHSDSAGATVGNVLKDGAGSATISSQVMLGKLTAKAGDMTVAFTGEGGILSNPQRYTTGPNST